MGQKKERWQKQENRVSEAYSFFDTLARPAPSFAQSSAIHSAPTSVEAETMLDCRLMVSKRICLALGKIPRIFLRRVGKKNVAIFAIANIATFFVCMKKNG